MNIATDQGVIDPQKIYTFKAVKRILDVGQSWIRQAVKDGLVVIRRGRSGFVKGEELVAFIERTAK